jgi:NADPH2:quinone reductase
MTKALGRPGQRVLVHGASGGVGLAALQIARAFGFEVIGTAGSAKGRALVAEQGAHLALDHTSPTYAQEILAYTAGRGVDIVLEMLANVNLNTDLTLLAPLGRVVVIGSRGDVQLTPRLTMAKDATITGMALWNTPLDDMRAIHAALSAGLAAGWLAPVIARDLPLSQAAQAHQAVLAPGAHGKIVLTA